MALLRIFLLLVIMTFSFAASAANTPIKLHSSAAFNQQAPTVNFNATPVSSNRNDQNMTAPVTQPYVPYYASNAETSNTATSTASPDAIAPSNNSGILFTPSSTSSEKKNKPWTITY